jgi:uncharacterized surface anchored protein
MPIRHSRVAALAIGTVFLGSCLVLTPKGLVQADSGFRIAGKVVNSTTGASLSQARVTIVSVQDARKTTSLITADDGAFAFTNLPAGKYSLEGARRGFITSAYDAHEQYSTAIVTGTQADCEHLVFRLTPQAVISGRVLDEAGDPLRRANVSLHRQDQSTGVGLVRRVANARTDDRGIYEFAELPAGNYFVSVNGRPWYALNPHSIRHGGGTSTSMDSNGAVTSVTEEESVTTPEPVHPFDLTYPTTYYSDTTDSDEATPIPVRGGERLTADVHLTPVPALRIVVHVNPQPGSGWAMPQLSRKSFDSAEDVLEQLIVSNSGVPEEQRARNFTMLREGEVEFSGIPPGKYTVRVPGMPESEQSEAVGEFDVTRNGQQINPSVGEPVSGAKLSVSVAGAARPPQGVVLSLVAREAKVVRAAPVDANGVVEILDVPPGRYDLVAANPSNDYSVVRMTINGSQSSAHNLVIPAGSIIAGTVTLVAGQSAVEGIASRAGRGVPGAMIVLVPKDPETNSEFFRRDQSDLDGSFSLTHVIPGEYTIVAIDNGWDLNWSQPGVIAYYAEKGQKVVVAPTVQKPIRLSEPVEVQSR